MNQESYAQAVALIDCAVEEACSFTSTSGMAYAQLAMYLMNGYWSKAITLLATPAPSAPLPVRAAISAGHMILKATAPLEEWTPLA